MFRPNYLKRSSSLAAIIISSLLCPQLAQAQTVTNPYTLSVFATAAQGNTQPDSIVQWRDSVLVGFQNGVAKDGSDGKSSTIVQYSLTGKTMRSFKVKGHNDGLRLVGPDTLWALQNEDANPNLVVIDLNSGNMNKYSFPRTVHGGGYDDIAVLGGHIFISASNPTLNSQNVNPFPALLTATLSGGVVHLTPVLNGNAAATDIPTGSSVTLNLTDPDSMAVDQRGNIVLDDQADAQLIFVHQPLTQYQTVGRINITTAAGATTLDDTAFVPEQKASAPPTYLLFADVKANTIYRLDEPSFGFEPGTAYSSSDTAGIVGKLDLDTGVVTPVGTGFMSTRGMIFVQPAPPPPHS